MPKINGDSVMDFIKDAAIGVFGLFVFAWMIVYLSGEFSYRKQNWKSVAMVMGAFILAIPVIMIVVNT
ncbi:MAG: hypothetical protein PF450_13150 [Bacteroidales bacterium]|nr:hypothetical protein [Bacteroidales bacterium]